MEQNKAGKKPQSKWYWIGVTIFLFIVIMASKGGVGNNVKVGSWDHSVGIVEDYLKHNYLRDPSSYESIKWYKVHKNSDGTYSVAHTFRAKNGFGGLNEESLTFFISKDGQRVTGYQ